MSNKKQGFPDCMYNPKTGKRCVFPTLKHVLIAEKVDPGWVQTPVGDPNGYELIDPPELPEMIIKSEKEVGSVSLYSAHDLARMSKIDLYELAVDWAYKGAVDDMNRQRFLSLVIEAQKNYVKASEARDAEELAEISGETGSSPEPEKEPEEEPKSKPVPMERQADKK